MWPQPRSRGKETRDGVTYTTVEFVKKAGTKGLTGGALAATLARVPELPRSDPFGGDAIARLLSDAETFAEAATDVFEHTVAPLLTGQYQQPGDALCHAVDALPAAAPLPSAW